MAPSSGANDASMSDFMLGIWFIVVVALIWAASSVLLQYVFEDMDFKSPFLVTYVENSCFVLYLPLFYLYRSLGFVKTVPLRQVDATSRSMQRLIRLNERDSCMDALREEKMKDNLLDMHTAESATMNASPSPSPSPSSSSRMFRDDAFLEGDESNIKVNVIDICGDGGKSDVFHGHDRESPLSRRSGHGVGTRRERDDVDDDSGFASDSSDSSSMDECRSTSHEQIFRTAIVICPIWFLANCLYNYSLLMTTVSSSTIISNLSGPFTLFFSWLAGVEHSSWTKWLGIFIGLIGVTLVAYADDNNDTAGIHNQNHLLGDFVALVASAGYGLYTTTLKVHVPDDNAILMQLLLGYLGLINAIILLPLLIIMIVIGSINLTKLTLTVFAYLILGGLVDNAISDYLWARSVVLTSPTVATVGLGLTIPLAMISDAMLGKEYPSILECLGAILVLAGFIIVSVDADDGSNDDKTPYGVSGMKETSRSVQEIGNRMVTSERDSMFTSSAISAKGKDIDLDDIELSKVSLENSSNPFISNHRTVRGERAYGKLPLSMDPYKA